MTLIVEDGTGKLDAESYGGVDAANNHHAKFGNTAWAALTTERKEINLRKATDYLVTVFRGKWQGYRKVSNQALDFPAYEVYRDERDLVDSDSVPKEVLTACFELALIAETTPLMPTNAVRGKKRVKVGPVEVEYDGNSPQVNSFVNAVRRLGPLLDGGGPSGMSVKLVRC